MKRLTILTVAGLLLGLASGVAARTWHVPAECPTIQAGIDAAVDGDTVLVADGIYTGDGNRDISFEGRAIVVMSEHGPELTIIDCQASETDRHCGFLFQNQEVSNSVVRGFTITNGAISSGGGILCDGSSPTITGNRIMENEANAGGGICCFEGSPTIQDNIIANNTATFQGGGIYCWHGWWPTIENNAIVGNNAAWGGGIYGSWSAIIIDGVTITENRASQSGGGIYGDWQTDYSVVNCIIWGDSAPAGPEIYLEELGIASVTYSDVEGGWPGEGNIDANPRFVVGPIGDHYLAQRVAGQRPESECVDAGDPTSLVPEGTTRTDEGPDFLPVDMGYHYPIGGVGIGKEDQECTPELPQHLARSYPNPFRSAVTIAYSLSASRTVRLDIYDVRGALVRTLVSGWDSVGQHRTTWDGCDGRGHRVGSGVYFCRLEAGDHTETKRMVLLR